MNLLANWKHLATGLKVLPSRSWRTSKELWVQLHAKTSPRQSARFKKQGISLPHNESHHIKWCVFIVDWSEQIWVVMKRTYIKTSQGDHCLIITWSINLSLALFWGWNAILYNVMFLCTNLMKEDYYYKVTKHTAFLFDHIWGTRHRPMQTLLQHKDWFVTEEVIVSFYS